MTELRSLLSPLWLWRTMLLVFIVGSLIARLSGDATAVLLISLACAFVPRKFERRRWIEMPMETQAADLMARIFIALFIALIICYTHGAMPAAEMV